MTYGSLTNTIYGGSRYPEPEVGMGATALSWTDRHPATIVEVIRYKTGQKAGQVKAVVIQWDKSRRTDTNGMSECQTYEFEPNPDSPRVTFTRRKNGRYVNKAGQGLAIGHRDCYYDYSF